MDDFEMIINELTAVEFNSGNMTEKAIKKLNFF